MSRPSHIPDITPYLLVDHVSKSFKGKGLTGIDNKVLDDITFRIYPRQFTALVGDSGSGKSTLARIISGQLKPTSGQVWLNGQEIAHLSPHQRRRANLGIQMVFQDPLSSLNPMRTIGWQLEETLRIKTSFDRSDRKRKALEMLEKVGLASDYAQRMPTELSGGQRQRVAIGCALIHEPELLIADEPVSALDLSVQAQILNLFLDLRRSLNFACLFISHDLDVVESLCDRVAVLHQGVIVEEDRTGRLFQSPCNEYTKELLEIRERFAD